MGHPTDKVEVIVMGGTFLSYPAEFQYSFVKGIYDALNDSVSIDLSGAKSVNEGSKTNRCVALCVETRPDWSKKKEIRNMLDFGATRCELGVQILDDEIYALINRGHTVEDVVEATQQLKDAGFKVGYHAMPGLPGSNFEKDISKFEMMFSDQRFRPDQIKLYPCQVIKGSALEQWHKEGKYKPYGDAEIFEVLIETMSRVPHYCRVMRVLREIPPQYLEAGTLRIDMRDSVEAEMEKRGKKCRCIRCREIGFALRNKIDVVDDIKLDRHDYDASGGKEIFLSMVNSQNLLFAICRLRIPNEPWIEGITKDTLLVRELHVYGPEAKMGENSFEKWQHRGFGKALMLEAERIAGDLGMKKIAVISGVGVRNYYKGLGYVLEGHYMVKYLGG
jgi:elongator complex protein 3